MVKTKYKKVGATMLQLPTTSDDSLDSLLQGAVNAIVNSLTAQGYAVTESGDSWAHFNTVPPNAYNPTLQVSLDSPASVTLTIL